MYAAASGDFFDFESTWRAVQPEDIVTLIYTSGTTGNPKGVEMTHANLLFEGYAIDEVLGIRFGDRVTSFLPSAHIADRMTGLYLQEMFGTQVTAVADARTIAAALPDVRPTVWGAVPRVWEKLKAGIEFTVARETDEMKRQALAWAMSVAGKRANALLAGESMSDQLVAEWAKADELVLSKLRERLGFGELRWALSGAAPIPKETLPPDALGYRCQVRQRHPVPSGSAASAVSAASSPGNTPPSHPVARVQRSRRWRASRRNAASSCVSVWDWRW